MSEETNTPSNPKEFNVVLDSPRLSPEAHARCMARLVRNAAQRRQPRPRSVLIFTFGDESPFIVVDEGGKRE